ncbi:MAG: hypothetical protein JWQ23_1024 [Herminiimonas sp.]|nr:hypothetical protein [Herminiimonas sp.]
MLLVLFLQHGKQIKGALPSRPARQIGARLPRTNAQFALALRFGDVNLDAAVTCATGAIAV